LSATAANVGGGRRAILRALRRRALADAAPIYLVGGPLRDVLLGEPIKDLDFVVEGDAPDLARRVAQELNGEAVTYHRFGTATVVLRDCRVDLVTARRETYPRPGALPEVSTGTILDDLARRDFSINALALPLAHRRPALLDPQGGAADLAHGVIRALHARSFADDPTRILRALRYEQRLGFRLEAGTWGQMQAAIRGGCLDAVSGDRLRRELERILEERRPELALGRAADLGVLAAIHPALKDGSALEKLALDGVNPGATPLAYLAALVYPLAPGDAGGVVRRLMMPGPWARVVQDTVAVKEMEPSLAQPGLTPAGVYRLVAGRAPEALHAVSQITASPLVAQRLGDHLRRLRPSAEGLRLAVPSLNGTDLLTMGVPAGPRVGQLLQELRDARLDGHITSETEERAWVRRFVTWNGGPSENG
jgi:tRNA nucleotidyltransferase (CCA-adding enzyme)